MYAIYHVYYTEQGGRREKFIGLAETQHLAKAYCRKWSKTRTYIPGFTCGELLWLEVKKPVITSEFDIYGSPFELWGENCIPGLKDADEDEWTFGKEEWIEKCQRISL